MALSLSDEGPVSGDHALAVGQRHAVLLDRDGSVRGRAPLLGHRSCTPRMPMRARAVSGVRAGERPIAQPNRCLADARQVARVCAGATPRPALIARRSRRPPSPPARSLCTRAHPPLAPQVLATADLPSPPVSRPVVEDVDGDGVHDVVLVCRDAVVALSLRRATGTRFVCRRACGAPAAAADGCAGGASWA